MAQPHPEGLGAEMAMKGAIAMSGTLLEDIGYVNAHATSTPVGTSLVFNDTARNRNVCQLAWVAHRQPDS